MSEERAAVVITANDLKDAGISIQLLVEERRYLEISRRKSRQCVRKHAVC